MPQLALLLTTFIWAATFPATKVALAQLPPLSFLFLRFLVSTVVIIVGILVVRRGVRWDRDQLRMAGIASIFLIAGYAMQTVGLRYTTASNSAFITALYVVFVPLFLRRFERRLWVALALALAGLWLLIRPSAEINLGDIYTLACAIAFALHIMTVEAFAVRSDVASFTVWQLIFVTVALIGPARMEGLSVATMELTPSLAFALVITGVLATGVAFIVQVWAQRLVPAQRVALIFALEPALAAWLSWLVLGEQLNAAGWVGSGLIMAGVIIGTLPSFRRAAQ